MLQFEDIRFDCALYNGYKPCRYGNECGGCPHYEPLAPGDASSGEPVVVPALTTKRRPDNPTVIVIIKTGAMDDVLRTTTLLYPLKREYPSARIVWITAAPSLPLLRNNPLIDELLELNPATAGLIISREFDVLLNFEKEQEPLALAGQVRARRRFGFAPTRWNTATVFNTESRYGLLLGLSDELKFHLNRKTYPEIISEMAVLPFRRDDYMLELAPESLARKMDLERELGPGRRPRIGLNTGCGPVFRTKQWPVERWLELIAYLQHNTPEAQLLLLGGKAEEEMNRQIASSAQGLIDTGSGNTLEQFFGVVDACDVVVASDTLAMHIAIALKKRVVALFGSTSATEVDLFDRGEKIITDFECSPCYLKTCDKSPMCMQEMSGVWVGKAVLELLHREALSVSP